MFNALVQIPLSPGGIQRDEKNNMTGKRCGLKSRRTLDEILSFFVSRRAGMAHQVTHLYTLYRTLDPGFESHKCLFTRVQVLESKRLSCHAGHQKVLHQR